MFEKYEKGQKGELAPAPTAKQKLYTPADVARIFRVDPKTVSRWASAGKFPGAFRTPGGHWRFPVDSTEILLAIGSAAG